MGRARMKKFTFSPQRTLQSCAPHHPEPAPPSLDTTTPAAGLRTIAVLEAARAGLVFRGGGALLSLPPRVGGLLAPPLVQRFHPTPARRYPFIFLQAAARVTDAKLWALAGGAMAYATVRFIEAYGLWHRRVGGEWVALLAGGPRPPREVFEVVVDPRRARGAELLLST